MGFLTFKGSTQRTNQNVFWFDFPFFYPTFKKAKYSFKMLDVLLKVLKKRTNPIKNLISVVEKI